MHAYFLPPREMRLPDRVTLSCICSKAIIISARGRRPRPQTRSDGSRRERRRSPVLPPQRGPEAAWEARGLFSCKPVSGRSTVKVCVCLSKLFIFRRAHACSCTDIVDARFSDQSIVARVRRITPECAPGHPSIADPSIVVLRKVVSRFLGERSAMSFLQAFGGRGGMPFVCT